MDRIIPYRILKTWRTGRLACYLLNILTRKDEFEELWRVIDPVFEAMDDKPTLERRVLYHSLRRDAKTQFRLGNDERCMEILKLRNDFAKYALA